MPIILESPTGTGGGGSGTVTNVSSANTGIAVANPTTTPTLTLATLDVIAADGPPAANWSNNSKKITSLANGAAAQDAAAFGQIPTALPPNGAAGGDLSGTYPNPAVKAITETSGPTDLVIGAITDGQVLKRVGGTLVSVAASAGTVTNVSSPNTSIVVTNPTTTPALAVGTLDVLATNGPPAADWSNNSHKITSLANGTAAQDAVAFGQVANYVVKGTDQTISASTTLTNDTALLFAIGASATEIWFVEYTLLVSAANATMDIKAGLSGPAAATATWGTIGNQSNNQPSFGGTLPGNVVGAMNAIGSSNSYGTLAGLSALRLGAWIFGGGNAGNLTLQWAQNTSDAGNLVMKTGSFLAARKIVS